MEWTLKTFVYIQTIPTLKIRTETNAQVFLNYQNINDIDIASPTNFNYSQNLHGLARLAPSPWTN